MKKYLTEEYHRWEKAIFWCMLIFVVVLDMFFTCKVSMHIYDLISPTLWNVVEIINVPYTIYIVIMALAFYYFTIYIAMKDRRYFFYEYRKEDGTVVEEKISATLYCIDAISFGIIIAVIAGFLSEVTWLLPILGIYSIGILICTPVCCAYAWCKQDPESPTDSIQMPPEPETETSQDLQENLAGTNPTPQEIEDSRFEDEVLSQVLDLETGK